MTNLEIEKRIMRRDVFVEVVLPLHLHGVSIPVGFVSNGASRPLGDRLAAPFVYEAIYHDYVYVTHEHSRWAADLNYTRGCIERGANRLVAIAHWLGLRLFGWLYW